MSDGLKVAPEFWVDHHGQHWIVPQIKGRLKCGKIPCHAALREFVLHRDGYKCVKCGESRRVELVPDHIISRRNGGSHHPRNLQCLCRSCNSRKAGFVDAKVCIPAIATECIAGVN